MNPVGLAATTISESRLRVGRRAHAGTLVVVAVATAAVLVLAAGEQVYDSNLVFLSEATALLAGDHPYRDMFEIGAPLSAYLSAGAQLAAAHRLIGEFVLQWAFIVAGVVIAFHLGMRLSGSVRAPFILLPLVLIVLINTSTYHYTKLFCVPLGIWLAWRYMDRPGVGRAAALGIATAVAFLFRHDHGIYVGVAAVLAVTFGYLTAPLPRAPRATVKHALAGVAAGAALLAPWAIVVHSSEGLGDYTRLRTAMYEGAFGQSYAALRDLIPIRVLTPDRPAAEPGVVGFAWQPHVDDAQQRKLEQKYGLRFLGERDGQGRLRYEVRNLYDTNLFELDPYITDGAGFAWERLHAIRLHLPSHEDALLWIEQIALLVPMLLVVAAAFRWWQGAGPDSARIALAAIVLVVVNAALLQKPSYVVTVVPLTAALSARFLVGPRGWVRRAAALAVVLLTTFAAVVWAGGLASGWPSLIVGPHGAVTAVVGAFSNLVASPPPLDSPRFRYLRECTTPGDRLLITGMTPFHVSYVTQRPAAGGHVYWRDQWGSDAASQARSLALLESQSVPFAIANRDPVMHDFAQYPSIREYLAKHYVELAGTEGQILVDTRRTPTRRFGPEGFPCFT